MSAARVLAVARKEFFEIWRDHRALAFVLVMPVLMILLYGYGIRTEIMHVRMAVWDRDGTPASREFVARFTSSGYFDVAHAVRNLREMTRLLEDGRAKLGVVIPEDFAERLRGAGTATVQFIVDGADANTASITASEVAAILAAWGEGRVPPAITLRERVWYNPDLSSTDFIVPGLAVTILTMLASILTALTVAREWERGTLEALLASPLRPSELMVGKLIPYLVIGYVDVSLITGVATLWFGVPLRGSVPLLALATGIFLVGALGVGLYISVATRSQQAALQLSVLVSLVPTLVLSGFIFPIEQMPFALQVVSAFLPARYFMIVVRGIFLKGTGVAELWPQLVVLAGFAVLVVALSALRFRRRLTL